jgi:hypothetical protein
MALGLLSNPWINRRVSDQDYRHPGSACGKQRNQFLQGAPNRRAPARPGYPEQSEQNSSAQPDAEEVIAHQ